MTKDRSLENDYIDIAALYAKIEALPDTEQVMVSTRLIELCRDVLMVDLATFRRRGAARARARGLRPHEIAEETESSPQTINRLLAERHPHGGGR